MRKYPLEFEKQKPMLFYPKRREQYSGDILEIGPGRGDLLLSLAAEQPDKKFVAIELSRKRYSRLERKIECRGIDNIDLICGNARFALPRLLGDSSFEFAYVLFPDPWPKRRHKLHRLLSPDFFAEIARVVRPAGSIFAVTDVEQYAQDILRSCSHVRQLENSGYPYVEPDEIVAYRTTQFEQYARKGGSHIYYMRFAKSE
ncbi:MAG: tRNA (guanine(46)-N(7))-methyltransferase TrmB [Candidatus Zixiibacteriota bacterium]